MKKRRPRGAAVGPQLVLGAVPKKDWSSGLARPTALARLDEVEHERKYGN